LHPRKTAPGRGRTCLTEVTIPMNDTNAQSDHAEFLSLLPRLATHARIRFRHLTAADREEAVADAVAYGFVSFVRLVQRGRQPAAFPAAFAKFIVLAAGRGQAVGRRSGGRDVLADRGRRGGFVVHRLNGPTQGGESWWWDAAADRRTNVADQAAFNVDFPAWLATLAATKRRIAELLAHGNSANVTARLAGVSPGRVSQVRRELVASWTAFHAGA
ncbi:MAG TPA: hypothetical protein VH120_15595, partial [Gemmataceae bacterium]|nr:hypothetical protein [Gemmataceae bacterium]